MKSSDNQPKKSKKSKEVDAQPAPASQPALAQAPASQPAQAPASQPEQPTQETQPEQKEIRLVDIPINDENTALNVMVGFLNLAHKRGVFTIDESAKIWECILKFQKPN